MLFKKFDKTVWVVACMLLVLVPNQLQTSHAWAIYNNFSFLSLRMLFIIRIIFNEFYPSVAYKDVTRRKGGKGCALATMQRRAKGVLLIAE